MTGIVDDKNCDALVKPGCQMPLLDTDFRRFCILHLKPFLSDSISGGRNRKYLVVIKQTRRLQCGAPWSPYIAHPVWHIDLNESPETVI